MRPEDVGRRRSGVAINPTSNKSAGRIDDDLWAAFLAKATAEGTTGSAKITEWIADYLDTELETPS